MESAALRSLLVLLASVGLLGCADGEAPASAPPDAPPAPSLTGYPAELPAERLGSLSFALQTEAASFRKFSYAITGPSFRKVGEVLVAMSNGVSVLIEGLPVGAGYTLSLSGTSSSPAQVRCSGSAPFTIRAGKTTDVALSVACHVISSPNEPPEPEAPPSAPTAAPLPSWAPTLLGSLLLAFGAVRTRRRAPSPQAVAPPQSS